jgi:Polyribonucleotide nucleotidyltransferase (polynucleotide phosphorylase)
MESNGSTSMASVCGGMLALMDAGVPVKGMVAGISIGLVSEAGDDGQLKRYELLTDIIGSEDHYGDMDFKLCGTDTGVTGFQLDLKLPGMVTTSWRKQSNAQKKRTKILEIMRSTLDQPRTELSKYAPRIETIKLIRRRSARSSGPAAKPSRASSRKRAPKLTSRTTAQCTSTQRLARAWRARRKLSAA